MRSRNFKAKNFLNWLVQSFLVCTLIFCIQSAGASIGNKTSYTYDGFDRLIQTTYPDKNTAGLSSTSDHEQLSYDANSNITTQVKRNGQTITQTFDKLNRLTARSGTTTSQTISYDLLGHPISTASGSYTTNTVYDNAGRPTSVTQNGITLSYQYDAASNKVRTTWPDGFYVARSFDALNRLTTLAENGTQLIASYSYDNLSRRASITRGNANTTSYAYDTQSALASLVHAFTNTQAAVNFTYARNQVNDITQTAWSNSLYQWTGYAKTTTAYTSNGLNQYTSIGSATPSYDATGNLTNDGTWSYSYNNDNQLIQASSGATVANLGYDVEGRLRQTAYSSGLTTNFVYDGDALVGEYDNTGTLQRRYIPGTRADETLVWYEGSTTANKNWLYSDHQGSIIATADATGTANTAYTYGPFGEPNTQAGVRLRYAGKPLLNLGTQGIYYNKARMYSPALGRFLQTDPIGYKDHMNMYAYVGNNPVNQIDPRGMSAEEVDELKDSIAGEAEAEVASSSNSSASTVVTPSGASSDGQNGGGGGSGQGITSGDQVTEEVIRDAMEGASLQSQQRGGISLPRVQDYVDRLIAGESAPAIKVDGNMIVDGNHRYVAGRIMGQEPPIQSWVGGRPDSAIPWSDIPIDPEVWE